MSNQSNFFAAPMNNEWVWVREEEKEMMEGKEVEPVEDPLILDRPGPMILDEDYEEDDDEFPAVPVFQDESGPIFINELERPAKRLRLDPGVEAAEKASRSALRELNSVQSYYANLSRRIHNDLIALSNRQAQAYENLQRIYAAFSPDGSNLNIDERFSINLDEVFSVWNTIRDARQQLAEIDETIKAALEFQKQMPSNNYGI